jgi:hypothetical protein
MTFRRLEESSKKAHGRIASRTYQQFEVPNAVTGTSRWKSLKTIGAFVYKRCIKGEERIDIRYFISSLPLGSAKCSRAARRFRWDSTIFSKKVWIGATVRTAFGRGRLPLYDLVCCSGCF